MNKPTSHTPEAPCEAVKSPTIEQIAAVRAAAGLTRAEAAALVHVAVRTWNQWEAGDRAMNGAAWELLCIKLAPGYKTPKVVRRHGEGVGS